MKESIVVYSVDSSSDERAREISEKLNIDIVNKEPQFEALYLEVSPKGLALCSKGMKLMADLTESLPRLKQGRLSGEMLVHAARLKGIERETKAIDATAGFGEDAILLAAAGFRVDLYEFDPIIFLLLEDAVRRAKENDQLKDIVEKMSLHNMDSIKALNNLSNDERPDIVLLDPMFPERSKTGSVKKKFQLLQRLESPCSTEDELLKAALNAAPHKIVIKRPAKGPFLAGRKPDYSVPGKAIRYDVIISNANVNG